MQQGAPQDNHKIRLKWTKWWLIVCTTLYIILFPFLVYLALLSSMVSDGPQITPFMVGLIMFIMFSLPLSIPISLYLMWSRYLQNQIDKARVFSLLPFYTAVIVFILLGVLPYLCYTILSLFFLSSVSLTP